jgi:hypothetical protein
LTPATPIPKLAGSVVLGGGLLVAVLVAACPNLHGLPFLGAAGLGSGGVLVVVEAYHRTIRRASLAAAGLLLIAASVSVGLAMTARQTRPSAKVASAATRAINAGSAKIAVLATVYGRAYRIDGRVDFESGRTEVTADASAVAATQSFVPTDTRVIADGPVWYFEVPGLPGRKKWLGVKGLPFAADQPNPTQAVQDLQRLYGVREIGPTTLPDGTPTIHYAGVLKRVPAAVVQAAELLVVHQTPPQEQFVAFGMAQADARKDRLVQDAVGVWIGRTDGLPHQEAEHMSVRGLTLLDDQIRFYNYGSGSGIVLPPDDQLTYCDDPRLAPIEHAHVVLSSAIPPRALRGAGRALIWELCSGIRRLRSPEPRPSLGIDITSAHDGMPVVKNVLPASPAAEVGLERGDVLESIDGQPVRNVVDAVAAIHRGGIGSVVDLTVLRGGRKLSFDSRTVNLP